MSSYSSAATSRRSHTKSRKGCKTCKRRHIRCDETFPQCRNCSKHQVRCDYMETAGESQFSTSLSQDLYWSSDVETVLDNWQKTGHCSVGDIFIDLQSSGLILSKSDLHLIYNAIWSGGPNTGAVTKYTIWTSKTPRFLEVAADTTFLLHAALGFGSLALAWGRNSPDAKSLAYQQGAIALQGLQTALGSFSSENADAVLASSILLSWQANDWRSWSSLVGGIRTILGSMQNWRAESRITDMVDELEDSIPHDFYAPDPMRQMPDFHSNYTNTLHSIRVALEHLDQFLAGREDKSIIDNLKEYTQRLISVPPAQRPDEQFHHLYALRKWLFWIPPSRLLDGHPDWLTLVVLAHLYAIPLALEPLFPEVAPAFVSSISLAPLDNILHAFEDVSESPPMPTDRPENLLSLLIWPQQVASSYRSRRLRSSYGGPRTYRSPSSFDVFSSDLGRASEAFNVHQPSPGFNVSGGSQWSSEYGSSCQNSPYLELPALSSGSSVNGMSYQSPMLPTMPPEYESVEYGSYTQSTDMDLLGLVHTPVSIWT